MDLKKFIIKKYKSIKNPVEIDFSQNLICFVGKNGSGKTNILEAIHQFYDESRYYQNNDKAEFVLQYKLTDAEISNFTSEIKINEEVRTVEIECSDRNFRTTRVEAKIYEVSIKKWIQKLKVLEKEIIRNLDNYYSQLKSLTHKKLQEKSKNRDIIEKFVDYNRYDFVLKYQIDDYNNSKEILLNYIKSNFSKNKINVQYHTLSSIPYIRLPELFQLSKENLYIDPLLAGYVEVDYKSYDAAIDYINFELKKFYDIAKKSLDEFEKIVKEINYVFENKSIQYYEEKENKNRKYKSFLELIKSTINQNCIYLNNENTLLFVSNSVKYNRRTDGNNVINKCINQYLKKNNLISRDSDINKLEDFDSDYIKKLIKYINKYFRSIVPKFDKDRIKSLNASLSEDGKAFIYEITEKNNIKIPLESTSLGRRWYLSYIFLKNSMEDGDILIVDEPASFLHPSAQKQILEDLYQLSIKNKVIFCTNSIDMIPLKIDKYYFVDIDDKGTFVKQYSIKNSDEIINQLGLTNYKEIIINKDIIYLFVEGQTDKELFSRFMKMKGVDLTKYVFFSIDGAGNGKVIYRFLLETNAKFMFIFDADIKTKFLKLDEIKDSHKVLVGINKNLKCIEGLFSEEDKSKYFKNNKLNIVRMKNLNSLDDLTEESIINISDVLVEANILDTEYNAIYNLEKSEKL